MKNISEIDSNFKVGTELDRDDITFYDCRDEKFRIYGIFYKDYCFHRLPEEVSGTVNERVHILGKNTAGGRVRFKTDSKCIAISVKYDEPGKMPHFAFTGSMGFDMYVGDFHTKTYAPACTTEEGYESAFDFPDKEMRDITINFPLYSSVKSLHIGLDNDALIEKSSDYINEKPVVYYGSSITQGGCASRPGTCYQAIISRRFNCDYVNLGFSGNAKAEDEMIDYINSLDMSLFVYDYDHNAPTVEHLQNTHEKMFKAIRKDHPELPIIMMSRPKIALTDEEIQRLAIVETTYKNAIEAGDKNVYFIPGPSLCELCGNEGTVDGCHPTDFGFASMAKVLGDLIEKNNLI